MTQISLHVSEKRMDCSIKAAGTNDYPFENKKNYGLPHTITKTNYNCIKNLNMKFTNIKILENFVTTYRYILLG